MSAAVVFHGDRQGHAGPVNSSKDYLPLTNIRDMFIECCSDASSETCT